MHKDAVILTCSSKYGGYCVAGLDLRSGQWLRFVSDCDESHGALTEEHIRFADHSVCRPLDVVRVRIKRAVPQPHQPENLLIDDDFYWKRRARWSLSDVLRLHPAERHSRLFGNWESSLDETEMDYEERSLTLIQVFSLTISRPMLGGKCRTRARFFYSGHWCGGVSVTDPDCYRLRNDTRYARAHLVVSLPGVPYDDGCYHKFVARVFTDC